MKNERNKNYSFWIESMVYVEDTMRCFCSWCCYSVIYFLFYMHIHSQVTTFQTGCFIISISICPFNIFSLLFFELYKCLCVRWAIKSRIDERRTHNSHAHFEHCFNLTYTMSSSFVWLLIGSWLWRNISNEKQMHTLEAHAFSDLSKHLLNILAAPW